ncbi:hypothetical protein M413DRAFT_431468 [Hebeloma cylindrosporum]|uniref:ribonuclease Z n=1 Tax=Hebeloma cylindrosporum TaxID=76867 RepID=A0A0C2YTT8_HEBCY|nr:hypothetical protein M413DRAFT_431468 [Hebeloma cylindrosporum h7]
MVWSTSVLTALSSDTEPSIVVTFNNARYQFNTSENTTRSFVQTQQNWRRTRALFFTQARVEKMSGLPGLLMSLADSTVNKMELHGPEGLTHILASMRMYLFRDSIEIQPFEIPWRNTTMPFPVPFYSDDNIKVYGVPVFPFAHLLPVTIPPTTSTFTEEPTLDLSGKRKREPSSEYPSKRLNLGNEATTRKKEENREPLSEPLHRKLNEVDNKPEALEGEYADEYRKAVIQVMFPATNIDSTGKTTDAPKADRKGKKASAGNEGASSVRSLQLNINLPILSILDGDKPSIIIPENVDMDSPRRSRAKLPSGYKLQLPKFTTDLPPSPFPPTMSYIVVGPRFRGKFDAKRAKELGIPEGPLRSNLAKGETITFETQKGDEVIQRTVKPEEVIGKSETPGAIIILDIPSVDHIVSLVSSFGPSGLYHKFWSNDAGSASVSGEEEHVVRVVHHLVGDGVLEDERYKTFMNGFGSQAHHLVASRQHCPDRLTFTSAGFHQLRLNKIDEQLFPIPKYSLVAKKDLSMVPGLPPKVQPLSTGLYTSMRPFAPPTPDKAIEATDNFHPVISEKQPLEFSPFLSRSIDRARKNVAQILSKEDFKPVEHADIGIIPLGTGGSVPSRYRNVLSTLIRIPGWGNILLDTGEGTWGQLVRFYGLEDSSYTAWQALRDLKCIFVSHMHGDHHIGLAHLLAKRRTLDPPPEHPLYVVSIRGIHLYLRELSDSMHYRTNGAYLTTGTWQIGGDEAWLDYQTMCESLGLEYLKTVDVYHACRCYGVTFKHNDGWSVTFSGDTQPTTNLVNAGFNSTVLIHEATMADDEIEMARRKRHSTIGEAITKGKQMRAKNTFLTHFSARYPKMPPYLLDARPDSNNYAKENFIVTAFDHLNITIGDMWKMQFYLEPMMRNFSEINNEDPGSDSE